MIKKTIVLIVSFWAYFTIACAQQIMPDTLSTTGDTLSVTNTDTSWTIVNTSTGTASYYAKRFDGRKTSSGQKFNHKKLTCAHKTFPFGTQLLITNISNNKRTVVVVNDRLPKKSKRTVDLTLRAAKELDFVAKGLTKVKIEIIK